MYLTKEQKQYLAAESTEQYTCSELTKMVLELDRRVRELEEGK